MIEPFQFTRPAEADEARLEKLADLIAFDVLGNTERLMIRRLAENGGPLDLVAQGLLAYSEELRYRTSNLDLENEEQLARALRAVRERKYVDFTIRLLERILTPLPEKSATKETSRD